MLQVPLDARLSTQMMLAKGGVAASQGHSACKFAAAVVVATCSHFVLPQFATVCRVCTSFSVYCANLVFSIAFPLAHTHQRIVVKLSVRGVGAKEVRAGFSLLTANLHAQRL